MNILNEAKLMHIFSKHLEFIRLHFNGTCCDEHGVPEECMGLCREKVQSRSIQKVLPIDRCVEHQDTIRTCTVEEGKNHI